MYQYQREALKELKGMETVELYGPPSSYSIINGFDEFMLELFKINPTLLSNPYRGATINSKDSKVVEEFGVYFGFDQDGLLSYTETNFLDVGLDDYKKKGDKVFLSVPELGTYYLLALGLINLDEVYGLLLRRDDTGLPFDLYLTKKEGVLKEAFQNGYEIPYVFEQVVYCLLKQLEDEEYIDFLQQATVSAQVLHHHIHTFLEHYKFQHCKFSRKVITPRFEEQIVKFSRKVDLLNYTKAGLSPSYAHLLFGKYYVSDEEIMLEASQGVEMAIKIGKTLGGLDY